MKSKEKPTYQELEERVRFLERQCRFLSASYQKNRELEERLTEALDKMLKGHIPICARCKKIRDSQGRWHKIEEYIQNHSDAVFSHSVCPSCAEIHYPDFRVVSKGG